MIGTPEKPNTDQEELGYGPAAAVLVVVIVYILAQLFTGAVLVCALWAMGKTWNDVDNQSALAQFFTIFLVEAFTLGMLWLFLRWRRVHVAQIGLVAPQVRDIGYAAAGYIAYFAALIAITQLTKHLVPGLNLNQEQDVGFDKSASGLALWLIFISLVILPPVTEEILMRGFLYTGLRRKLPMLVAALITSAMFATAHLWGGTGGKMIWVAALDTFTLSMILVYLRERTGSLWPSIGVHMLKNGAAFMVLFILKLP